LVKNDHLFRFWEIHDLFMMIRVFEVFDHFFQTYPKNPYLCTPIYKREN